MATQLRELEVDLITRGHLERGIDALREQFAGCLLYTSPSPRD